MKLKSALFFSLTLALLAACSTNPVTGKNELHFVSESQEISMGEQNYEVMLQAQGGDYVADEGDLEKYVQEVGDKLAKVSDRPGLPYEFALLDNSVPNAWALPGGKIAINRGLLIELDNEAELAAVLAHEIVHSAARHGAKQMERALLMGAGLLGLQQILKDHKYEDAALISSSVAVGLLTLKYSREAELEADHYGIKYMVKAGYDPEAAVTLQEKFLRLSKDKNPNWFTGLFATHPPSQERKNANTVTATAYPEGGYLGAKEYQEKLAPLRSKKEAYANLDEGYLALINGNASKAFSLALAGIKQAPKEGHLYNLRGKAEIALDKPEEAKKSFDKAVDLNPHYFDFYLQRGLVEKQLGEFTLARLDLEKSLTLLPSADAHYALGIMDLNQGLNRSGIEHLRVAAQADNTSGQKARALLLQLSQ